MDTPRKELENQLERYWTALKTLNNSDVTHAVAYIADDCTVNFDIDHDEMAADDLERISDTMQECLQERIDILERALEEFDCEDSSIAKNIGFEGDLELEACDCSDDMCCITEPWEGDDWKEYNDPHPSLPDLKAGDQVKNY